jgi:hypothetical protein
MIGGAVFGLPVWGIGYVIVGLLISLMNGYALGAPVFYVIGGLVAALVGALVGLFAGMIAFVASRLTSYFHGGFRACIVAVLSGAAGASAFGVGVLSVLLIGQMPSWWVVLAVAVAAAFSFSYLMWRAQKRAEKSVPATLWDEKDPW